MDERGAYIDLVFRNGLKDYEVLPPPEVWDNIHPVIKNRQKPLVLLRVAALITVVLSISFLAYRLSQEMKVGTDSTVTALNFESVPTVVSPTVERTLYATEKEKMLPENSSDILVITMPDKDNEMGNTNSPEVVYFQETKSLTMNKSKSLNGLSLASVNSFQDNTFKILEPDQQYLPLNSKSKVTERWSIAAMASPTYFSNFNSGTSEMSKQLAASEKTIMTYSGGFSFNYKINKRFSIQSGLYYSSLGKELDGIKSYAGFYNFAVTKGGHNFEVLTSSGSIYTNNSDVFLVASNQDARIITNYNNDVFDPEKTSLQYINNTMRQTFSYLELPVFLRYKFVDRIIDFNLIGGVSYNLLVTNSAYTMVGGSKYQIGKTEGLNLLTLSSSLGLGMEYSFSENLSLNLEPTFRYYLNPFSEMTSSKIHPYSFGIFSGVSYKF